MDHNINVRARRDALVARREQKRSIWHELLTTVAWPASRKIERVRRER